MLKHYILVALRNFLRCKLVSLINIAGLAIGMAACLLIFLFVEYESSYDTTLRDGKRIYRALAYARIPGTALEYAAITSGQLTLNSQAVFPEIEDYCRITRDGRQLFEVETDKYLFCERIRYADSTFFRFFNFTLRRGDPNSCLVKPYSLVLTTSLVKKMFGAADPVGLVIKSASGFEYTITGVMDDPPENTHLPFDGLRSLSTYSEYARISQKSDTAKSVMERWGISAVQSYFKLKPETISDDLSKKLSAFQWSYGIDTSVFLYLQPLCDIHLNSGNVDFDKGTVKGDIKAVYALSIVAIVILIIAAVNFMNLSTARAVLRAREVGIRKISGALRKQLIRQFLGESVLTAIFALILALALTELSIPLVNQITGYHLHLSRLTEWEAVFVILGLILAVGVLAGAYPAVVLSQYRPIDIIKGAFHSGARGRDLRRVLVVFQFTLSIAIIATTIFINRQLHYISTKDLGYNREQVLLLNLQDVKTGGRGEVLKTELSALANVASVAFSTEVPGRQYNVIAPRLEGCSEGGRFWNSSTVDFDFLPTYQIRVAEGRGFLREFPSDTENAAVLNETAAVEFGIGNTLGKRIYLNPQDSTGVAVIGVVKDFHFISLHEKMEPLIILAASKIGPGVLSVKLNPGKISETIKSIDGIWKKINPEYPFVYQFMDEEFAQNYRSDFNFAHIGNAFSILAVIVACSGLFGLASHTTEQRRKEIGIRKVLGASVFSISRLLVMDYIRWVAIANIVAWPVAFWVSQRWLDSFAYHVDLTWIPFVVSGLLAMAIAVITVLGHALHAAASNPVNALRYE